jgi:hypothetical protein
VEELPANISLLPLPLRSPELNSQENIWQFMRQNWLSNRIFKSFDDIVDWYNRLQGERFDPYCSRQW